jgi:CheY-like chemotaxis protein
MMGGTIEVESTPDIGSKFTFEIAFDIDTTETKADMLPDEKFDLGGMKLLLAEDNALNAEIAQCLLEEAGAVVTTAENGQMALDLFRSKPTGTFDAILMDVMMPIMNGIDATKAIRALERPDAKTIPIIAMTANAYAEDVRATREAGMNAHLSKPINAYIICRTLYGFYKKDN